MIVTIIGTQIFDVIFNSVSLAHDPCAFVRNDMSIHDVRRFVLITKGIKPYVEVSASVNQVEVNVPGVFRSNTFSVLN